MKTHGAERMEPEKPRTVRASIVPAAIGLDSSFTRYDAYRLVAHGEEKEPTPFLKQLWEFGTKMEPLAVSYVEQVTGEMIFFTGDRQKELQRDRYTCHPDGIINESVITEVKSRSPKYGAYDSGDKNWVKHMAQVQQNLWISDSSECLFACFCVNGGSRLWRVHRSEEYIEKMHKLLKTFCQYVDGEKPCPQKLKRRPRMPAVKHELLDGPAEDPELRQQMVESIAHERAKPLATTKELDELEAELIEEYPGMGEWIARGTKQRQDEVRLQAK